MGIGIYTEDENRFLFNNVIVGRTAKARFKLSNSNKVNNLASFELKRLYKLKISKFRFPLTSV